MLQGVAPLVHQVTDDEVQGEVKQIFEDFKAKAGKVPKWMRVMANNEDTFVSFFSMFKAIMDNAPVEKRLKWKIAYKVSELNKCKFCVSVSISQLKATGMSDEAIKEIGKEETEAETVALRYSEEATLNAYKIETELFEDLKKHFTDEQIVEITSVVGLFSFINRFNDALRVLPDIG